MEKKNTNPRQQQLILPQYLSKCHTIHLSSYCFSFFHSKVQVVQDIVSLLLICLSPYSGIIVYSRAADVHCSRQINPLPFALEHQYVPAYKSVSIPYLHEVGLLCIQFHGLLYEEDMENNHREIKPFALLFWRSEI